MLKLVGNQPAKFIQSNSLCFFSKTVLSRSACSDSLAEGLARSRGEENFGVGGPNSCEPTARWKRPDPEFPCRHTGAPGRITLQPGICQQGLGRMRDGDGVEVLRAIVCTMGAFCETHHANERPVGRRAW